MPQLRDEIFEWAAIGRLPPRDVPNALEIGGVTPQLSDWRNFLQTLLLWTGIILVASGVIFFFAYNWRSLHRVAKFALAETIFAAALLAVWQFGIERPAGKAAVLGAALLTGALLALLGQTYQSGADTFELFAFWAALILPWVIAARFAPLWLVWIGLLNLAVSMYFQARAWGMLGFLFGTSGMLWALFVINVIALAAWELGLVRGIPWLNRWGARVLATLTGGFATTIGILSFVGSGQIGAWAVLAYAGWILSMYLYYRIRVFDVFMLAGGVLSGVIVTAAFLGKHLLPNAEAGGFLLIGLVVIGMSGAGAAWIHRMLQERSK